MNNKEQNSMVLTENEKELLIEIAYDNESGNHLLGRKRSAEYWQLRKEWAEATVTDNPTERQAVLIEFVRQSSDYGYYMSLPLDKRMF